MRGNLRVRIGDDLRVGSIPARAGEPSSLEAYEVMLEVYPRACGGTVVGNGVDASINGLSPRVRGNPTAQTQYGGIKRSIPARAGEP